MSKEEQVIAWLREVLPKHNLSGKGFCGVGIYIGEPNIPSDGSNHWDLDPQEGSILEIGDQWILMRNNSEGVFFVCARNLAERVPSVGSSVRITPYARRGFDGRRLDTGDFDGVVGRGLHVIARGRWRSPVPVDAGALRSASLLELLDQIVCLRAADGIRRLSHVLIDAGATLEPPRVIDASVPEVPAVRPSLAFRIRTQKADGWLRISCAERLSEYRLDLLNSGSDLVRTVADDVVSYDVLTSLIVELIDDGRWRFAKVEYTGTNVN